ncbi:unnamed protein product [Gordionus sp. m RMFG-2023]
MWHNINHLTKFLSKKYEDAYTPVLKVNNRENDNDLIWKKCLKMIPDFLQIPLSSLYLRYNIDPRDKIRVEEMADIIRDTYVKSFRQNAWMDEITKNNSIYKVHDMKFKIGYPQYILDPTEVDKDYEGKMEELPSHICYNQPSMGKRNRAYLFGAIGSIISYFISHSFNHPNREFKRNGVWESWLSNKSLEESFKELQNCYRDQYSKYWINDQQVDGIETIDANIADNSGIFMALQALKNRRDMNNVRYTSNSNITEDQLFFLAYAQARCSNETVTPPPTSPYKYRVNGVVSNLKEFSDAFSCSRGDPMNPPKKCTYWDF